MRKKLPKYLGIILFYIPITGITLPVWKDITNNTETNQMKPLECLLMRSLLDELLNALSVCLCI
jgi:hypothetical protein